MNRREMFKLIPFTLAGMGSLVPIARALEHDRYRFPPMANEPLCLKYPKVIMELPREVRATQS